MVNFILSLNLSFLKIGGVPQYSRVRNKFMALLMAKKLYINQLGTTPEYAYEQVVAFTNSCYTDHFDQVRWEIVNFVASNAEFPVSPTDINAQLRQASWPHEA